jgi:spermidine/putrescine transport system substrate-binding protein
MKKTFYKLFVLITCFALMLSLSGCGNGTADILYEAEYSRDLEGTVLNVFNWGEYIADGSEGSLDINEAFTELTGIKVNYTTYESNEAMYAKLKSGGVSYDIIIPSDYMIERLKNENMLEKIDTASISNYKYIDKKYKDLYFDAQNEYSVPYCVGMVGLIYNAAEVDPAPKSWSVMWDEKYKNQILTFNNPRDAFAISQFVLGQDLNTTNLADWDRAAVKLKEQKKILQSYVMDEVFQKMEDGEALIAPYYAGDFLLMQENNPDLEFVYPKEGTNIFVDSICIPKGAQNIEAAKMYINFLLEPEIALETAEYIRYATPHTAVLENPIYSLRDNTYLYPTDANYPKVQYFHDIDNSIRSYYEKLWEDVKLS